MGAGTMGCYNGLLAAIAGYEVVMYDANPGSLGQVLARQKNIAGHLVTGGLVTAEMVELAYARISLVDELSVALANADLISESVFERLEIKRDIHCQIESFCKPEAIITTNSSSLLVSEIECVMQSGRRFAALHTHLGSPLVDIVAGPRTDKEIVPILVRYVESIGASSLVLRKEWPGYILNGLLGSVLTTANLMLARGVATRDEIDSAWMYFQEAPMGPFGLMDFFGLDIICDSWAYAKTKVRKPEFQREVLNLLRPMVEAGSLGMKTGGGFYNYPAPSYQSSEFVSSGKNRQNIYYTLILEIIRTAVLLVSEDVSSFEEIDYAWCVGMSLKKGPVSELHDIGFKRFQELFLKTNGCYSQLTEEQEAKVTEFLNRY